MKYPPYELADEYILKDNKVIELWKPTLSSINDELVLYLRVDRHVFDKYNPWIDGPLIGEEELQNDYPEVLV